ncbi:MAG TPA: 50S ribosomal protein L35 [Myxococcales bacterium]|nr:50S ribosomal protein L35 [Myxococcales bacterium]
MGYKLKTNSGAKKRFKLRPSGKVAHKQRGVRHNAGPKSQKRKRHLRGNTELILRDEKKVKELFPYAR